MIRILHLCIIERKSLDDENEKKKLMYNRRKLIELIRN